MAKGASRTHKSLDAALARKRVVLWYDPNGEWASEFDEYQPAQAEKLRVEGSEFTADRASLDIQEAGLTLEFKELAQEHKAFFRSPVRTTKLKELRLPNHDKAAVRLKLLAVLAKQQPDVDTLLPHAFARLDPANPDGDDPVEVLGRRGAP